MRNAARKPPVTPKQFYRVVDLMRAGVSARQAAIEVGLSRGTVGRIYRGYKPKSVRPDREELAIGPLKRCPECGKLVNVPCVYCRTLAYLAAKEAGQ